MLRQVVKHNSLVAFVGNEDVAGWLGRIIARQRAQGSDHGAASNHLVAEASTGLAALADGPGPSGVLVVDEVVLSLDHIELLEDSELHGSTALLAALLAVTPHRQRWIARHLSLEGAAHARPLSSRHLLRVLFLFLSSFAFA
eukprot:CAMPEP_0119568004 /NCGR_PEP_ID=MMETSP1352-20130426/37642_1 /TAXON_ID=265584 /ORGANISM="Stauroneis constricta, Strain CCMP1120" /LENGTH=141 /DNA_ID=CAMNT_0007617335 /DNA_START=225 /DNA_END=647 /DNA_ORIENTATION=-